MVNDNPKMPDGKGDEQETRERILAAARQLMALKGYKGAATRKIAEIADVNEVTLFRHFKNKEGILVALLEETTAVQSRLELILNAYSDIEEMLVHFGREFYDILVENQEILLICMIDTEYRPEMEQYFTRIPSIAGRLLSDALEKRCAEGQIKEREFDVASQMFISTFVTAFIVRYRLGNHSCPAAEFPFVQSIVNILLRGLQ